MSYENMFDLPDYDGGPRDQLRDAAKESKIRQEIARNIYLAELHTILSTAIRPHVADDEASHRASASALKALQKAGKV